MASESNSGGNSRKRTRQQDHYLPIFNSSTDPGNRNSVRSRSLPNPSRTDPIPVIRNYIIATVVTMVLVIALILYLLQSRNPSSDVPTKVLGLVGVHTTYLSADRRAALRSTWFPAHRDAHIRETSLEFVFVIGNTRNGARRREIEKENEKYGDILILNKVGENTDRLKKTLAFFKAASQKVQAEYYIRADDDIYLRPDRLSTLLMNKPLEYVGCKRSELVRGKKELDFAYGSIYILSAKALEPLANIRLGGFMKTLPDDYAIGYALNSVRIKLQEQRDLCHSQCTQTSIAVWNFSCLTGPCNPVTMLKELHKSSMCSETPTIKSDPSNYIWK